MLILFAGVTALIAATVSSLFTREDSIVILCSMAAGFFAVAFMLVCCILARRSRLQTLLVWLVFAAVFIGVAGSHLPLRLIFRLHRAEFDHVVAFIENGIPPAVPFWIGPFRITIVGQQGDSKTPFLATNNDVSEIDGFVRHPQGHGFNLWSSIKLDDSWSYISED